jgi:hypothetical protein
MATAPDGSRDSVDIHGDDGYSQIALFGSRFDGVERLGVLRIRGQIRASEVTATGGSGAAPGRYSAQ